MDVSFCVAALDEALASAGIKISMDGCGRWMDNVFIERLWRSLKHEDIYLKGYADGREAKVGIANWIAF
jgi:putative transposase